jgi:thiosulfate/3-mercaptopyruvate sulfurtransferase
MWRIVLWVVLALPMQLWAQSKNLVSVEWLAGNLGKEDIVLIDASPPPMHAKAHIPGAVSANLFAWGGRDMPNAEMQTLIQSWGVSEGKRVVLYDQGGTFYATSLLFDLYYYGVPPDALAVLDGGMAKWKAAGGAVTSEGTPAPRPGSFRVAKLRDDARVRLPEFIAASGDPDRNALVEALSPEQHFGAMKFFDRAGHIPNAVMAPAEDFFNADKTFKSPEEIRHMLAYLGIRPEQQLYAHCGGGLAASVPFFAAKFVADYPKVKLYKESQLEWLRDDRGLPMWTYDAPSQLRDKAWLAGWTQPMLRQFGVSKISIVDIRPAAVFAKTHMPFAANVPSEAFREGVSAPGKLAETLAAAGVKSTDEAVIVSEKGLNPESALAWLALEKLGQKRVSILSDSVDDWAFAGLPMAKENAPALQKTRYVAAVGAAPLPSGYPRVYLASGKTLPAQVPEGKVIHVPYTELVNADGLPKPAKDLWAILAKAGVPRYAELVAVADDPGEAAVGYFVLKLMGYPDVKLMPHPGASR